MSVIFDLGDPGVGTSIDATTGALKISGNLLAVACWWAEQCPRHGRTRPSGELDILHVSSIIGADTMGVWWNDQMGSSHLRSWEQVHNDLGSVLAHDPGDMDRQIAERHDDR